MVCSAVAVGDLPVFYAVIDQTPTLHWSAVSCRGAADCVLLAPQPPPSRDERHQSIDPYADGHRLRSEEHTSELQSRRDLVCRLLLEKKKKKKTTHTTDTQC